jgi:rubrerythrin
MQRRRGERIRELKEQMEALVIAVPKEEAAHRFYLDLARSTSHEGTRRMFMELAGQELEHKRKLEGLLDDMRKELAGLEGKG